VAAATLGANLSCAVPHGPGDRVQLGHGSGGKLSAALLKQCFLPHLGNPILAQLGDGAVVSVEAGEVVVSTDSFVVSPLVFPGGDIGSLAVHGSLNDLAMMGAEPRWLTAGFIIEEGLTLAELDRIVQSMGAAARAAGIPVITGDTKVVERGKGDGLFINTTGIGVRYAGARPGPDRACPGDAVLVSGPIGRHGMAIMAARGSLGLEGNLESDSACLWPLVRGLVDQLGDELHVLRDPTRGGIASALNEIAAASRVGVVLEDGLLPIPAEVNAACEMLGLDPLYVANEGIFVVFCPEPLATEALRVLRAQPLGGQAALVGRVVADHPGFVVLETALGAQRVVDLLPGDQLPRIC